MTLSRPQRELLSQLVFRWPHPCFVVRSRYGHYALVVTTTMRSRSLERMDRGYSSETVDGLATAGLIGLTWVDEVPAFGFRRAFDGVHGSRIEVTPRGRVVVNAVTEEQQCRAQAISAAELVARGAEAQARATRVARGEVPGDARPVDPAGVDPVLAELQGAHPVGGDFGWAAFLSTARDYLGSAPSEPTSDTLLTILDVLCAVTEQAKRRGLPLMVVARGDAASEQEKSIDERCSLCGRLLGIPGEVESIDCGGDCWGCMRAVEGHAPGCSPPCDGRRCHGD